MTAAALCDSFPTPSKKKFGVSNNKALAFLDSIDSKWKENETFALWLVQRKRPKTIVDLGFDKGLSTIAFAYRNLGHVFGIDWFEAGNYAEKSFALDSAFRNISQAIRLNYVKNIHLIIGPFCDVSKNWKKKIDVLHIDSALTYASAKSHYEDWVQFLQPDGIILINDILSCPQETGRFFQQISSPKIILSEGRGLGIATQNEPLLQEIQQRFKKAS
jgi:predicted O-methyltransferase YrrM